MKSAREVKYMKEWRRRNREHIKAYQKAWRAKLNGAIAYLRRFTEE